MSSEVTLLLHAINRGEPDAAEQLMSVVYSELRSLASAKLAHERPGHTLQSTDLVNEVYLRLFGDTPVDGDADFDNRMSASESVSGELAEGMGWNSRRHFFSAAAEAMRRILIDRARARNALKRGGDRHRVDFELGDIETATPSVDLLALDEALARLERQDMQKANVVKLRYFAGLTIEQTAQALGVSEPTVKRHWNYSRAWLKREMGDLEAS